MNPTVAHLALTALAQIPEMESAPRPNTPSALDPSYFELLERNSHIIYPALGVLVVVLLVAGILQAWRTQDLDALDKVEFKREILNHLRMTIGGSPAEAIARAVGLEPFKTVKLLEELQKDGVVLSHTNTSRLTLWRIKGQGGALRDR